MTRAIVQCKSRNQPGFLLFLLKITLFLFDFTTLLAQQLLSESIETNNECNFESDEQKSDWLHAKSFAQVVSQGSFKFCF